jgi:hypothetical protein
VFLKVVANLLSTHSDINYKLRFVGKVSEGVKQRIAKAGLEGITEYISYVPHQEAIKYMMESTMLLLSIAEVDSVYIVCTQMFRANCSSTWHPTNLL